MKPLCLNTDQTLESIGHGFLRNAWPLESDPNKTLDWRTAEKINLTKTCAHFHRSYVISKIVVSCTCYRKDKIVILIVMR